MIFVGKLAICENGEFWASRAEPVVKNRFLPDFNDLFPLQGKDRPKVYR